MMAALPADLAGHHCVREAAQAHRALEARSVSGKMVLVIT